MSTRLTESNDAREDFEIVGVVDQIGRQSYDLAKGVAKFTRDMTKEGMVYARALRSPYAHATVKILDISEAEALEGVVAIISWDDEELQQYPVGWEAKGGYAVLSDRALFEGDECGVIVVARTDELCKKALDLIKVEWTVLPHSVSIHDAKAKGAPILRPEVNPDGNTFPGAVTTETGNVAEGFAQADKTIEFDFEVANTTCFIPTPYAYMAYCEPDNFGNADYGDLLWVNGGGGIDMDRDGAYSQAFIKLGLSMDQVRQTTPYIGGRYCHWTEQRGVTLAPWLTRKLNKPIRYIYSRKDAFSTCTANKSFRLRVGFTNEGLITAVQVYALNEVGVGWRDSISPVSAVTYGTGGFGTATLCENLYQRLERPLVNTALLTVDPANFDTELPNMAFCHIAEELGKDPIEVMLLNIKPSAKFSLNLCIEQAKKVLDWDAKYHAPGTKTLPDGRLHGLAMAIGYASTGRGNRPNINLSLKRDGKVYLPYNEMEVGIHVGDMYQLIVAEESGMKLEDVVVYYSPHYPNWCAAASDDRASCASYTVKEAAINLKTAICKKGFSQLGASSADEVDVVDSKLVLKADPSKSMALGGLLHVSGWSDTVSPSRAKIDPLNCMFIDFCEVAVDSETGQIEVLNHVMSHDVGKVLRESGCVGQLELHAIMFDGAARLEEVVWDKNSGALLNGNTIDYKIPTRLDVSPTDIQVIESRNGYGAYGASSLGHAHIQRCLMVAAVSNALGTWVDSAPVTPDKVLRALGKIK